MKHKRLLSLLLCGVLTMGLLGGLTFAAGQTEMADGLNSLGLFLGTGKGYELEKKLTRAQGITLAVRALGKEQEAQKCTCTFADVNKNAAWAAGYVGYAFQNGMTMGTSKTAFSPSKTMTDAQFLTIVLRILGYSDVNNPKFTWDKPYYLAKAVGLVSSREPDTDFTRGDAVSVFWNALKANIKGTGKTLAAKLIEEGVFTEEAYTAAVKQAEYRQDAPFDWTAPIIYIDPGDIEDPESTIPDLPTQPEKPDTTKELTWSEYQALSPEEKEAYYNSFATPADFFAWRTKAQAAEQTDGGSTTVIDSGGTIDVRN